MNNLEALLADHDSDLFNALDCDCCVYHNCEKVCIYDFDMCECGTREWLLSEHVDDESCNQVADQGEHAETPLASKWQSNDAQSDSREKLEADVTVYLIDKVTTWSAERYALNEEVIRWLNRQAEITERETEKKWSCFSDSAGGHITELSREIGTLRAERDRYRELCGKLLDAADDMRRVRDAFDQFERGEA